MSLTGSGTSPYLASTSLMPCAMSSQSVSPRADQTHQSPSIECPRRNSKRHDCKQLSEDGRHHGSLNRKVIKRPHNGAAGEPCNTESRAKKTVSRTKPLRRDHLSDGGLHHRLMSAETDAPEQRSTEREDEAPGKCQWRIGGGDQSQRYKHDQAVPVEQPAERQRTERPRAHRQRVKDRDPRMRNDLRLGEVKSDERVIGEAKSNEADGAEIPPESPRIAVIVRRRSLR